MYGKYIYVRICIGYNFSNQSNILGFDFKFLNAFQSSRCALEYPEVMHIIAIYSNKENKPLNIEKILADTRNLDFSPKIYAGMVVDDVYNTYVDFYIERPCDTYSWSFNMLSNLFLQYAYANTSDISMLGLKKLCWVDAYDSDVVTVTYGVE